MAHVNPEFEKSFFQLAYDRLNEKLQNLLPYMVGFEVAYKNDEGTKAVGVFGFKVGDETLFVPTFFNNGRIKGLELLYSERNDSFYPFTEDFAQIFITKSKEQLGEPSKVKKHDLVAPMSRGMLDIVRPPQTGRYVYGSAQDEVISDETFVKLFSREKRASAEIDIADMLTKMSNEGKQEFRNWLSSNDQFLDKITELCPIDKLASALVPSKEETSKLAFFTSPFAKEAASLDDEAKSQLFSKGYYTLDKRAADETSKVYNTAIAQTVQNPTENGYYLYVTASGGLRPGYVVLRPYALNEYTSSSVKGFARVYTKAEKAKESTSSDSNSPSGEDDTVTSYDCTIQSLFVYEKVDKSKFPEFEKSLISIKDTLTKRYDSSDLIDLTSKTALINIYVSGEQKENVYHITNDNYFNSNICDSNRNRGQLTSGETQFKPSATLVIAKGAKSISRPNNNQFVITSSTKAIKLHRYSACAACAPGKPQDMNLFLASNDYLPTEVRKNNLDLISIKSGDRETRGLNQKQAMQELIINWRLTEKQALDILSSVEPNTRFKGIIKVSNIGDISPQVYDAPTMTDEYGNHMQPAWEQTDTYPEGNGYTGNPLQPGLGVTDPNSQNSEGSLPNTIAKAQQLVQGGQSEIFNNTVIANMAKYVNPSNKISEYIPGLLKTIDELGRMVFMLAWNSDKFGDLYGKDDLPEFNDTLLQTFKGLGEIFIFLKNKSPDISLNDSAASLGQ